MMWRCAVLASWLLLANAGGQPWVQAQSASPVIRLAETRLSLIDRAALSAERTGVLQEVTVHEGETVKAGAHVAKLRDQIIRAQLAIADKQLENDVDLRFARKAAELATLEFSKSVKVNEGTSGTISEIELRRLRLASEKALLQLEQAQWHLELARLQREETAATYSTYTVMAPWSGVVMKVNKRRGEAVREGEAIVEIADLARLRAEGYVTLSDSLRLRPGQEVRWQWSIPGLSENETPQVYAGRLTFIEPKVDPVTQKVRIWAEVENVDSRLKDGMQGVLFIAVANGEATLQEAGFQR
ncbi:efflux RND transporter periplasmic adaptor subunit [bacterium]|nr:efflux RND transporter periplasmic adaptor subunit [bacterium]